MSKYFTKKERKKAWETYEDNANALAGLGEFSSQGTNVINQGVKGLQGLGTFNSDYQNLYGDAIENYANMGKFEYNLAGDPLFNQYKDNYTQMGKNAMQDTMGQAAALTGGYGNSYATAAGQQAYNSYMSELNNRIPELYSLALQNYNTEASRLQNIANLYGNAIDRDMNIYNANRGYYGDVISGGSAMVNADATTYNNTMNYLTKVAGLSFDEASYITDTMYKQERDAVSDKQWRQTFDYNAGQDAIKNEQWEKTFGLQQQQFDWDKNPNNPSNIKDIASLSAPITAADGSIVPEGSTTPQFKGFSYTGNISKVVNSDGTITYTDANGKSRKVEAGTNPFTGNRNSRVMTNGEYDPSKAISSKYGYMPNTAPNGKELTALKDGDGNKVKITYEIFDSDDNYWGDNTQTVWKTYEGGRGTRKTYKYWTWDVTKNDYVQVKYDGEEWIVA